MPLIRINDDKGNPINLNNTIQVPTGGKIKGDSKSINPKTGKMYPKGYTPEIDYVLEPSNVGANGLPVEFGSYPDLSSFTNTTTPQAKRDKSKSDSDKFKDNLSNFKHIYDYVYDEKNNPTTKYLDENPSNNMSLHLGSYAHIGNENEDPTVFGYDVIIDMNTSPLFNGALRDFLNQYSSMTEVKARLDIYDKFREAFFKLIRTNTSSVSDSYYTKGHYLKQITGLNALSESSNWESNKVLTDYEKDYITLSMNEDVTMLTSEMIYLYKTLAWSKINGKQMIPANLLRFNCEIVVSEVRRFKRVYRLLNNVTTDQKEEERDINLNGTGITYTSVGQDGEFTPLGESLNNFIPKTKEEIEGLVGDKMKEINDLTSKIRYKLYECTFFMQNYAHSDTIDLTNLSISEGAEISFIYKFTSTIYEKITWGYDNKRSYKPSIYSINNKTFNLELSEVDNDLSRNQITETDLWEIYSKTNLLDDIIESPIDALKKNDILRNNPAETLKKNLLNALTNEVNRRIISRMRIVNNAFDNIRNGLGLGKISEPTNIYEGDYYERMLSNDVKNALRDYLGDSIKDYFGGK